MTPSPGEALPEETRLAACPFCGGRADYWVMNGRRTTIVCCVNTECIGNETGGSAEQWNRRAATALSGGGKVPEDVLEAAKAVVEWDFEEETHAILMARFILSPASATPPRASSGVEPASGKLAIMGAIDTANPTEKWPMAILITFSSVEDIRRAIKDGVCRYTFGEPPASPAAPEAKGGGG